MSRTRVMLAVAAGLDDHVRELLGIVEAAQHVERVLEAWSSGAGGMPIWPAGHLLALLLQRLDDVLRRQAARLHLLGIEPDAHRVLAGAEHVDVADAGQPRDLVLAAGWSRSC